MDFLEYIREIGCEVEKSMSDAVAQGMTDTTIHEERHLTLQRNFISSKLADTQYFATRMVSLLDNSQELNEIRGLRSSKTCEDALADLLESVEKLETSNAKKNLAFSRQNEKTARISDESIERHFYHRLREPIDVPNMHTAIVHGAFATEESFGRYIDLHKSYDEFRSLVQNVVENISLSDEEKERLSQSSYQLYFSRIESHVNNIPQRVKYGALTESEALAPSEITSLRSSFLSNYAAYLHRLGDHLKRSHLKAFPLDVGLISTEHEKFPSPLAVYFHSGIVYQNLADNASTENTFSITAVLIQAAEERVRFWVNIVRDKILATTRMLERRQIITPEEVEAEESREVAALMQSLQNARIPSWAYVIAGKETSDSNAQPVNLAEPPMPENSDPTKQESTIPLWLRKINGLNVRLFCQVCNQTYAGPTIFEQHFREFRHSQCLSRLGIINIPAMHGVDTIDEAKRLWKKIMDARKRKKAYWTSEDVEYEDENGEICTKRMTVEA